MTSTATRPGSPLDTRTPAAFRLVRSELLKIRTTNAWWIFALGVLVLTGLTFLINMFQAIFFMDNVDELLEDENLSPEDAEAILVISELPVQAANLYTSGQFLVLIVVLVVGILTVTNEFYHQTATSTFLTAPHRTAVIMAKVVAACVLAVFYWGISTAFNIPVTMLFLQARGLDSYLGDPEVGRAILLNLVAYLLWAVFGVGFGVLLRSQIAATVTGILLYLAGFIGAILIFDVLGSYLNAEWLPKWQVIVPSVASQLMVAGAELPGNPPRWVGAVVLLGWSLAAGTIGVLVTRRRDVS
jgi:ABC-type transport system involved in multi-copper enzyme maturation permease subunit